MTDCRAARHAGAFAGAVHVIPSATVRGKNPISLARTGSLLGYGFLKAWLKLPRLKPAVVVGFGGYPTVPPLLAATVRGIPTIIHEQNAVMGRANRLLAPRVRAIATGFPGILNSEPVLAAQGHARRQPGAAGGDRGVLGRLSAARQHGPVPAPGVRRQPGRARDGGHRAARDRAARAASADAAADRAAGPRRGLRSACARSTRDCKSRPRSRRSSPICRRAWRQAISWYRAPAPRPSPSLPRSAGPAILVPLPHALDQDQRANAGVLMQAGGAIRLDQAEFTPDRLAAEIAALAAEPARLAAMAKAAKADRLDRGGRAACRSGAAGGGCDTARFVIPCPGHGAARERCTADPGPF